VGSKRLHHHQRILGLGLFLAVWAAPLTSEAAQYSELGKLDQSQNSSIYVETTSIELAKFRGSALSRLGNPSTELGLRESYAQMLRKNEMRERYSLSNQYERQNFYNQSQGMAYVYLDHIKSEQSGILGNKFKSLIEENPVTRRTAEIIIGAYAIYSGKPIKFKPHNQVKMSVSANVAHRTGAVEVSSPLGETRVDVAPQSTERAVVSFSKVLSFGDIRGGMNYGVTSKTLVASLTKPITQNLSATYQSRFQVENVYSLNYGIIF
jgi:hypothetical protein